jgi:hypothetical protein
MTMTVDFLGYYGGDENLAMMVHANADLPYTGLIITPENLSPKPVTIGELQRVATGFVDLSSFQEPERQNGAFILRPLA